MLSSEFTTKLNELIAVLVEEVTSQVQASTEAEIDYDDLARSMDYDTLAVSLDVGDLALEAVNHTSLVEDVAYNIDNSDIAEMVGDNIDASDVAENVCPDAVGHALIDIFMFNHKRVREQAERIRDLTKANTELEEKQSDLLSRIPVENHPDNPTLGEIVAEMNSSESS